MASKKKKKLTPKNSDTGATGFTKPTKPAKPKPKPVRWAKGDRVVTAQGLWELVGALRAMTVGELAELLESFKELRAAREISNEVCARMKR